MGAEELTLGTAVRRVAHVAGRKPLFVPLPVWAIRVLAQLTEWSMIVPLVAKAQAQMLSEGVSEVAPPAPEAPVGIRPSHPFSEESIRAALPSAGRFGWSDLRLARWLKSRRTPRPQAVTA
jgi:NADH dehydrogenase